MTELSETTEFQELLNAVTSGYVGYATWAELAAVDRPNGSMAEVDATDAGTHEDPLTALTVNNTGRYRKQNVGWVRLGDEVSVMYAQASEILGNIQDTETDINATLALVQAAEQTVNDLGNAPLYAALADLPVADGTQGWAIIPFGVDEGIYEDTGSWTRQSDTQAVRATEAADAAEAEARAQTNLIYGATVEVAFVAASIANGKAFATAGEYFAVPQPLGTGVWIYHYTGGNAVWHSAAHYGNYHSYVVETFLRDRLQHAPSTVTFFHSADAGRRWANMFAVNVLPGVAEPTPNLLVDPWGKFSDQAGGVNPVITYPAGVEIDSLGNTRVVQAVYDSDNDLFGFCDTLPAGNYTLRAELKQLAGDTDYRFGAGADRDNIVVTPAWVDYTKTLTGHAGGTVGVYGGSAVSGQASTLGISCVGIYDADMIGDVLPTAAAELAAQQACHGKAAPSVQGLYEIPPGGGFNVNGNLPIILTNGPDFLSNTGYTFGIAFKMDGIPTGGNVQNLLTFFYEGTTTYAKNSDGDIALSARDDSFGRPYTSDSPGDSIENSQVFVPGTGWHTAVLVQEADNGMRFYVDGRRVYFNETEPALTKLYRHLLAGAYNGTLDGDHTSNNFEGEIDFMWHATAALSEEEVSFMCEVMEEGLVHKGAAVDRRNSIVLLGDSISDVNEWLRHSVGFAKEPPFNAINLALGGSDLDNWQTSECLKAQHIMWNARKHFKRNIVLVHLGNEGQGTANTFKWTTDAVTYSIENVVVHPTTGENTTFKAELIKTTEILRRADPSAILVLCGLGPIAQGAATQLEAWTTASLNRELERIAFMDAVEANPQDFGFDAVVNVERGTVRLTDTTPTFAAETDPGSVMGDYQAVAAAIAHSRTVDTAVTLSAASGSAITATAVAGTFSHQDVYRKLTGDGGDAWITAVNGDGSVATCSTDDQVATARAGEPAGLISSLTVTRSGFGGTAYASGQLSVESDNSLYNTDGLHPAALGNRLKAEAAETKFKKLLYGSLFLG